MTETPQFPPDDLRVDFGQPARSDLGWMARLDKARNDREARREQQTRERAERERQTALARFNPVRIEHLGLFVCPWCSALVQSAEVHLDWHGSLAATASRAAWANMMTRPIG